MKYDFGYGEVPAKQHPNGGGWVADTAYVEASVYVGPDAKVFDSAKVYGGAEVYGNARVYGSAWVYGNAEVYDNAWVSGNAWVFGFAWVFGNAKVYGGAKVFGSAKVFGNARLKRGKYTCTPTSIVRSDGYTFTYQSDNSIVAGCRDFTLDEAEAHWGNPKHHKYKESYAILASLIAINKSLKGE